MAGPPVAREGPSKRDGPGGISSWVALLARGTHRGGGVHALHAGEVSGDAAPIARGGLSARGAVVAADRQQPVLAGDVLLLQNLGGDRQVAIWVKQIAGVGEAVLVVPKVDLSQARVDARVRRGAHRLLRAGAGVGAGGEAAWLPGDVERPGPRHEPPIAPNPALLQGHGVEHGRGNARALCGELVGRWRNLMGMGAADV